MKKILKLLLLFLFLLAILYSCQTNKECDRSIESLAKIGFYKLVNDADKAITINNISVYGIGREDSLLYEQDTVGSVFLPLSPASKTVEYVLAIADFKDTISFSYSTKTYFASKECGFIANYDIDTIISVIYTENTIDTVKIVNNLVTVEDEEHIQIFFN